MSRTIETLLGVALSTVQNNEDDDAADKALGFIIAQAASAAGVSDRTWRNDAATTRALKLATPLIIDLLAPSGSGDAEQYNHPLFHSVDEHARQIFFWVLNRLKERGDEYGSGWPKGHPLRNFPLAAAALNLNLGKPPKADE
jgi:hypothetical protein